MPTRRAYRLQLPVSRKIADGPEAWLVGAFDLAALPLPELASAHFGSIALKTRKLRHRENPASARVVLSAPVIPLSLRNVEALLPERGLTSATRPCRVQQFITAPTPVDTMIGDQPVFDIGGFHYI